MRQFFRSQETEREYELFKRNDWANTVISVATQLGVNTDISKFRKPSKKGLVFCERRLFETDDSVVRNNIIVFMSNAKANTNEYCELLLEMLALHARNERLVRSVITIMSDFFYDRKSSIDIFQKYVSRGEYWILTPVVKGVARSKYFSEVATDVVRAISGVDPRDSGLRRILLTEVARKKGQEYLISIIEYGVGKALTIMTK